MKEVQSQKYRRLRAGMNQNQISFIYILLVVVIKINTPRQHFIMILGNLGCVLGLELPRVFHRCQSPAYHQRNHPCLTGIPTLRKLPILVLTNLLGVHSISGDLEGFLYFVFCTILTSFSKLIFIGLQIVRDGPSTVDKGQCNLPNEDYMEIQWDPLVKSGLGKREGNIQVAETCK